MTIPTHVVMGAKIMQAVQRTTPFKLNRRWFLYGNIYPDISRMMVTAPHFADVSAEYVRKRIRVLGKYPLQGGTPQIDALHSMQLGILCHYVCDFFCHVHSPSFSGPFRHHLAYELRQQHLLLRRPRLIGRRAGGALSPLRLAGSVGEMIAALDEAQAAYQHSPHRADIDLVLAVKTSSYAVASLLVLAQERVPVRRGAFAT